MSLYYRVKCLHSKVTTLWKWVKQTTMQDSAIPYISVAEKIFV